MTKYNNALLVQQAYPEANFNVSNFFPLIGENVTLTNTSSNIENLEWTLNTGTEIIKIYSGNTVNVTLTDYDKINQKLKVTNSVDSQTITKSLYGLINPDEAYYEFSINTQVARVDEEINIELINKYNFLNSHDVSYYIYDYDGNTVLSKTLTGMTDTFSLDTTGIYDIEVQANTNGNIIYFKKGMILTITPKLSDINDALIHDLKPTLESKDFYGVPYSKIDGDNYNFTSNTIESGTTIVLRRNEDYPEDSIYRIRLQNLKGTKENPIIVTTDSTEQLKIGFESYWGLYLGNCEHVIIDGRGYNNLKYGIKIYKNPNTTTTATAGIQGSELSTNTEFFGVEICDMDFTGVFYKTDPKVDHPETWRENFCSYDLKIHNNYIHNTLGEGNYLGYFNQDILTGVDSNGTTQTYRAHLLMNTKIYRNTYYRCGWDSIQLNNSSGDTVIAYNTLIDSAWYGEPDQNTGMSLGLTGKIHNNIMIGGSGIGIQIGPIGKVDIYNNIITDFGEGSHTLFLLGSSGVPEQNVDGSLSNNIPINIYNNNLICVGRGQVLSAQNVVQYNNVNFFNNIIKYITKKFGGQATITLNTWESNSSNNIRLEEPYYDTYKIASEIDNNYNIYSDSVLSSGGLITDDMYDIRGYKNWSISNKFIGAYSGVVKVSNYILNITNIIINNDDQQTNNRNINVLINYNGEPTDYIISEYPNFSGSSWLPFSGNTIPFTISESDGTKTVYVKIKNNTVESNIENDSIYYTESTRILISLNSHNVVYDSPSPWNNFNASTVSGNTLIGENIMNLVDQYNSSTQLNAIVTTTFDDIDSNAYTTEIYPYIYESVRFNWSIYKNGSSSDVGTIIISGCTDSKLYDVLLYANKKYNGGEQIFSVNGVEKIYNHNYENIQNISTFNNVSPISGIITIETKCYFNSTKNAIIGVIDITEHENGPTLDTFTIESGQTNTNKLTVSIDAITYSSPTEYLISENSNFINSQWITYNNNTIQYTFLTSVIETKYIYLKFKNVYGESQTVVKSINYDGSVLILDSIDINLGASITISPNIIIDVTYHDGTPTDYRISDNLSNLSGETWYSWTSSEIQYTLPSEGTYTLYLQLRDSENETDVVNDSITYNTSTTTTTTTAATTTTTTTTAATTTTTTTTVFTTGETYYLIDFGIDIFTYYTENPFDGAIWNNFMYGPVGLNVLNSGITLNNLVNTNSGVSNLSLTMQSDNWYSYSSGGANSTLTGATISNYDIPGSALRDTFVSHSGLTGITLLTGCDDLKLYKIGILSSKYGVPDLSVKVQGVEKIISPPGNTEMEIWDNVSPLSGTITMEFYSPTHYGYLNLMEIVEE